MRMRNVATLCVKDKMVRSFLPALVAITLCRAAALPGLPALSINGVTVSGISSGADFAAQFAVAYSDVLTGSAIFAGQAFMCALQRFEGEPQFVCDEQKKTNQGPGCVGYPDMGQCIGCDVGKTLGYDHCKVPAWPSGPGWVNVSLLTRLADSAAAAGFVSPTSHLSTARTYLYRGSRDTVYLDGAVNRTRDFFLAYAADAGSVKFVADIPSAHAQPTADPWLSPASCGPSQGWAPPAMQNCGYDGAGDALQHMYEGALTPPPTLAFTRPDLLTTFDQSRYTPAAWGGLSSLGYVYIPPPCSAGGSTCRLHVALHGCGMSIWSPSMNTSFVEHTGLNQWALENDIVVLYPQAGGFIERGITDAPSAQMAGGCWDGYGQTGADYAYTTGLQMVAVREMIRAVAGF